MEYSIVYTCISRYTVEPTKLKPHVNSVVYWGFDSMLDLRYVHCTLYSDNHVIRIVLRIVHITMYTVYCTIYIVIYNVHCTVYIIPQCTLYNVMYNV